MERFAAMYAAADSAILVWSMGLTQHAFGSDNVRAVDQPRAGARQRRAPGCRAHADPRATPGCRAAPRWAPTRRPSRAASPVDARVGGGPVGAWGFDGAGRAGARRGARWSRRPATGGSRCSGRAAATSSTRSPTPAWSPTGSRATPVRVHQDIVVTSQMLVDPGEVVVLLPAATRYEQRDGGTETTTERRIAFSPQIKGPQVGEARTEWEIFTDLAARVDPGARAPHHLGVRPGDPRRDRARWCRCTPASRACGTPATRCSGAASACATAGSSRPRTGAAHFAVVEPPERRVPEGHLHALDPARQAVQLDGLPRARPAHRAPTVTPSSSAPRTPGASAWARATRCCVRSETRRGARPARTSRRIRPGNVQMFFPECNPLIRAGERDASGVPDYNAVVEVLPAS